jgi:hypothetical protein
LLGSVVRGRSSVGVARHGVARPVFRRAVVGRRVAATGIAARIQIRVVAGARAAREKNGGDRDCEDFHGAPSVPATMYRDRQEVQRPIELAPIAHWP